MTDKLTLFYSWQSDRDSDVCRNFIENALKDAVVALAASGIEVAVDSDTRNVSGSPLITPTILDKISKCNIFLGDLTYVAKTDTGKHVPNPNVMAEYGYALRCIGYNRILLAMNTAFGLPENLPFDLQAQRFPLRYDVPTDIDRPERRNRRSAFAMKLADAIKAVAIHLKETAVPDLAEAEKWSNVQQLAFERFQALHTGYNVPAIITQPKLTIQFVPLAAVDRPPLDAKKVYHHVETFMPPGFSRSKVGASQELWWSTDLPVKRGDRVNPEALWSFALLRPGLLEFSVNLGLLVDDDPTVAIPGRKVEAWLVIMTEQLQAWADAMGLGGPALLAATLDGMEDTEILGSRSGSFKFDHPRVGLPYARIVANGTPVASQLRETIDGIWLAAGNGRGSPSFGGGGWDGYAGGPGFELD
jgi:hypothetical protein